MAASQAVAIPPPESLDVYLDLGNDAVARMVLCLLIEEELRGRLAVYRLDDLAAKPVEGEEELLVVRSNIMPVGDAFG
jgi:hypothetical protein